MRVEDSVVEEQIIGDERFDLIDSFFAANQSKKLMFYFQVGFIFMKNQSEVQTDKEKKCRIYKNSMWVQVTL